MGLKKNMKKNKVTWGILGAARIAKNQMIPAIRATSDGEVLAIGSKDIERATNFAKDCQIPRAYGSYEELLHDPDINAVYIALPTGFHYEWCIKAAKEEKAVLCEKPITTNANEAKTVADFFSSKNILISESLMYRYHPLTKKVKEIIKQGTIGKPILIHSVFTTYIPKNDIRFNKDAGGGVLLDLGCYCISFSRFIAEGEPIRVSADGFLNENNVDLTVAAVLLFSSDITAMFFCSFDSTFDCQYTVLGEKGILSVERGALCAWPGEEFHIKIFINGKTEKIKIPEANHYKLIVEDFQNVLLGRKDKMELTFDDSIANMQTLDKIRKCMNSQVK